MSQKHPILERKFHCITWPPFPASSRLHFDYFQATEMRYENGIMTRHKSNDTLLCLVRTWCKIVHCIKKNPDSTKDTTMNAFMTYDNKVHAFTGTELLKQCGKAAKSIGSDVLGFSLEQFGLHSARSGAAMAMYLSGVLVLMTMLIGHWSSNTFLCYIRKQVKEFS